MATLVFWMNVALDGYVDLTQFAPDASFLMLRGPFTNQGLAQLAGLDGLFGLNVDSRQLAITGAGLAPLAGLPHFGWLAFDARDESMPYIAAGTSTKKLFCKVLKRFLI